MVCGKTTVVHETHTMAMPLHCSETGECGDRHADLSQPDEEVEDVGVVVDYGPRLDVGGELGLALSVEGFVEIILALIELVLAQCDGPASHHEVLVLCGFFWVSTLSFSFWVSTRLFPCHWFQGKIANSVVLTPKQHTNREQMFHLKDAEFMLRDVALAAHHSAWKHAKDVLFTICLQGLVRLWRRLV